MVDQPFIHTRVSTLVEFSQRLIERFFKRREEPSPPVIEACTSAVETMEEEPSSSTVWEANTYEEETLAALKGASKFHQGMTKNPSLVISANTLDGSTSLHAAELEQQNSTALYKSSDEEKRNHFSCEHSKSISFRKPWRK